MLVAESYFQVENRFSVALKAEMTRLDDSGMDRTDGDLMDLIPGNPEKISDTGENIFVPTASPGVPAVT